MKEIRALRDEKYATWEWNYGRSGEYDTVKKERFPGGSLEIRLQLDGGRIREIRFFGDYLSLIPSDELTDALIGTAFRREDVAPVLQNAPIAQMFGGIKAEEILELLFR